MAQVMRHGRGTAMERQVGNAVVAIVVVVQQVVMGRSVAAADVMSEP